MRLLQWSFPIICLHRLNIFVVLYYYLCDIPVVSGFSNDCPRNAMARYKMELRGTWMEPAMNKRLLPVGFPQRWTWSNGIGVSLDGREEPYYNETIKSKFYNFVRKGGLAQTVSELNRFGSGVLDTFIIPATASTGGDSTSVFFVDSNHSRISFMSRMNHKPHWILSVDSANLCHKGRFRDVYELDLFPSESKHLRQDVSKSTALNPPKRHHNNNRNSNTPGSRHEHSHSPGASTTYYTGQGQSIVSPRVFRGNGVTNSTTKSPQTLVTPRSMATSSQKTTTMEPVYLFSNEIDHGPSNKRQSKPSAANDPESIKRTSTERSVTTSTESHRKKSDRERQRSPRRDDRGPPKGVNGHPYNTVRKGMPVNKRMHGPPTVYRRRPLSLLQTANDSEVVLNRSVRAANYGPQHHGYIGNNNRYHQGSQRSIRYGQHNFPSPPSHYPVRHMQRQDQPLTLPDALPRLATVRFVKIATYHLSHLPPAVSRRKPRMDHQPPLPITVQKAMLKSQYLPYRGLTRTGPSHVAQPHRQQHHSPGYGYSPSQPVLAPVQAVHPRDTYVYRAG